MPERILPDFLIIGAQKSGTTWLANNLRDHPDVFVADHELHFFDKARSYDKGVAWYSRHFAGAENAIAVGEKTPDYMWTGTRGAEGHVPDTPCRIHSVLPNAKLLLQLRNPVDRALSAALHLVRSGRVHPSIQPADLLFGSHSAVGAAHGLLDYGHYRKHIDRFLEYFSRDSLLILIFEEDVLAHPGRALRRACEFLGVKPDFDFPNQARRRNRYRASYAGMWLRHRLGLPRGLARIAHRVLPEYRPTSPPDLKAQLQSYYEESNQRLFEFLGREIPQWRA